MSGVDINRLQALEQSKHRGLLRLIVCCVVALWVPFSDRALAQLRKKKSMKKDPVTLSQGTAMQACSVFNDCCLNAFSQHQSKIIV